jgi:hypothetical protein
MGSGARLRSRSFKPRDNFAVEETHRQEGASSSPPSPSGAHAHAAGQVWLSSSPTKKGSGGWGESIDVVVGSPESRHHVLSAASAGEPCCACACIHCPRRTNNGSGGGGDNAFASAMAGLNLSSSGSGNGARTPGVGGSNHCSCTCGRGGTSPNGSGGGFASLIAVDRRRLSMDATAGPGTLAAMGVVEVDGVRGSFDGGLPPLHDFGSGGSSPLAKSAAYLEARERERQMMRRVSMDEVRGGERARGGSGSAHDRDGNGAGGGGGGGSASGTATGRRPAAHAAPDAGDDDDPVILLYEDNDNDEGGEDDDAAAAAAAADDAANRPGLGPGSERLLQSQSQSNSKGSRGGGGGGGAIRHPKGPGAMAVGGAAALPPGGGGGGGGGTVRGGATCCDACRGCADTCSSPGCTQCGGPRARARGRGQEGREGREGRGAPLPPLGGDSPKVGGDSPSSIGNNSSDDIKKGGRSPEGGGWEADGSLSVETVAEVGLYKLTHSLKAPGFNP